MRPGSFLSTFFLLMLLLPFEVQAQDLVWARQFGGESDEDSYGVATDSSGNIYTVGRFAGSADFDPGPDTYYLSSLGSTDVFISKLDDTGSLIWAKQLGGPDDEGGYGVAVDAAGFIYIAGYFRGTADFDPGPGTFYLTAAGITDAFVCKLNKAGDLIWAKRFGGLPACEWGTYAKALDLDDSSNVYVAGYFCGTADFDPGGGNYFLTSTGINDAFVLKLTTDGEFAWAGSIGSLGEDDAYGVAVDDSGNVYVSGSFSGTADFDPGPGTFYLTTGDRNAYVLKVNTDGDLLWVRRLGVTGTTIARSLAVDRQGSVYTVGYFSGTADFDPGPDNYSLTSIGEIDVFVSKLGVDGDFLWARGAGGANTDWAEEIAVSPDGSDLYVVGWFNGTGDFDPGPGTYYLTAIGTSNAFILNLDSAGLFGWGRQLTGRTPAFSVTTDLNWNIYITGAFLGTADFDPGPATLNLTPLGGTDAFVCRFIDCVPSPTGPEHYGRLLFAGRCTQDAGLLPGDLGSPYVFDSVSLLLFRGSHDKFYLSSASSTFLPLIVDDAVRVNTFDSGLGPYAYAPDVPPFKIGRPIEENLVPEPACDVTSPIPEGNSIVLFELLDTQREIYGNTAVFFLPDCGISMEATPTTIHFISHDDQVPTPRAPEFEIRYGLLSHLRVDRDFLRITCLGHYYDTPAAVMVTDPPLGDAYYFLARGISSASCYHYGDSTLDPDPRDPLDTAPQCP